MGGGGDKGVVKVQQKKVGGLRRGRCKLESVWDRHHRRLPAGTAGMYTSRSRRKQRWLERPGGHPHRPTKPPSISLFQPVTPSTLPQLSLPSGGSATPRLKCVCSCAVVYKQDVAATGRNPICTGAVQSSERGREREKIGEGRKERDTEKEGHGEEHLIE